MKISKKEIMDIIFEDENIDFMVQLMTELQKQILLNKCNEREQNGYDHLNNSDIMDILKECERCGQPLSCKEIEYIFED